MVKRIFFLLSVLISFLLFTTGCWDRLEIEERGFVVGAAIDLIDNENGDPTVQLTSQFVIPGGIGAPTQGGEEDQNPYMNFSATGESLFSISREMRKATNYVPFYQHLKVLILSEDVVKEPHLFTNMVDVFIRDHDMRRNVKLLIAEGEAKKLLNTGQAESPLPAIYIDRLLETNDTSDTSVEPVIIGDIQGELLVEKGFIIPKIKFMDEHIKYNEVGVFQGQTNQLIGILDADETRGLNYITQQSEGGSLELDMDGNLITLEITDYRSNTEIKGEDEANLQAETEVKITANIVESFGSESVLTEEFGIKLEEQTEEKVEQLMKLAIDRIQGEMQVDVLGMSDILYRKHYDLWKEVEGNWDRGENYFSQLDINVSANVKIERAGASDVIDKEGEEIN
jgi:spore germination protein